MPSYVFPGFPIFLESAAAELGLPGSAGPARRIVALTDLANLCSQASRSSLADVPGILTKAAEFRDQLAIALKAADLMLVDVEAGRRLPMLLDSEPETDSPVPTEPRSVRRNSRNERVSS